MMPGLVIRLAVVTLLVSTHPAIAADTAQEWRFRVLLDDKPVGTQVFELARDGETTRLLTYSDLNVRFLFVTVYRYAHRNSEVWENGCLVSLESTTDANRRRYVVSGRRADGSFQVSSNGVETRLPECVKSFAYWDASILREQRLLNAQNGEFVPVEVSAPVAVDLRLDGATVAARRYELTARDMQLRLWYSLDDRWLALESNVRGGRVLRYELM